MGTRLSVSGSYRQGCNVYSYMKTGIRKVFRKILRAMVGNWCIIKITFNYTEERGVESEWSNNNG